ncbi:MAG: radical SAM family heme chaperone HemW [Planctomycetota bacterium]|nr:MAG: radical SAM family heme chaperone HemW [Planctomycetota bacterium]
MHLYIHIPYCQSKCPYCDFNSIAGREDEFERYVSALLRELSRLPQGPYRTLFMGGGTPSILPPRLLERLCRGIAEHCDLAPDYEWSMEANPGSVDRQRFAIAADHGVNRVSIGVQSVHQHHLAFLGRGHTVEEADQAVAAAQTCFQRVSCDLMVGLPQQTMGELSLELDWYRRHGLRHASVYHLAFEPGTEFHAKYRRGDLSPIADDISQAMLHQVDKTLQEHGLEAYETSNYAVPGEECQHNLAYWQQRSYWAVGAGAVSTIDTLRCTRERHPGRYIAAIESGGDAVWSTEQLGPKELLAECWMLGLRLRQGVSQQRLRSYGDDPQRYQQRLSELCAMGYVTCHGDAICLTPSGRPLQDAITIALMPEDDFQPS